MARGKKRAGRFKTEARLLNGFTDPKGIHARLPLDEMVK